MYLPLLRVQLKPILRGHLRKKIERRVKNLSNDAHATFLFFVVVFFLFFFLLIFFIKTYVVGTHLNCNDKSVQFKWVLITYACIKV